MTPFTQTLRALSDGPATSDEIHIETGLDKRLIYAQLRKAWRLGRVAKRPFGDRAQLWALPEHARAWGAQSRSPDAAQARKAERRSAAAEAAILSHLTDQPDWTATTDLWTQMDLPAGESTRRVYYNAIKRLHEGGKIERHRVGLTLYIRKAP